MTTRFEHQTRPDPVILAQEMCALFHHVRTFKVRATASNQAHWIAAGMSVDAEK
jgi:hypothetical protein